MGEDIEIKKCRIKRITIREARRLAHSVFDKLWKPKSEGGIGLMTRSGAYRELRLQLGKDEDDGHIGMLNEAECMQLVDVCRKWGL